MATKTAVPEHASRLHPFTGIFVNKQTTSKRARSIGMSVNMADGGEPEGGGESGDRGGGAGDGGMVRRVVERVAEDAAMIDVGEKPLCLVGSIPSLLRWDACFCYRYIVPRLVRCHRKSLCAAAHPFSVVPSHHDPHIRKSCRCLGHKGAGPIQTLPRQHVPVPPNVFHNRQRDVGYEGPWASTRT